MPPAGISLKHQLQGASNERSSQQLATQGPSQYLQIANLNQKSRGKANAEGSYDRPIFTMHQRRRGMQDFDVFHQLEAPNYQQSAEAGLPPVLGMGPNPSARHSVDAVHVGQVKGHLNLNQRMNRQQVRRPQLRGSAINPMNGMENLGRSSGIMDIGNQDDPFSYQSSTFRSGNGHEFRPMTRPAGCGPIPASQGNRI